MYFWNRMVLAPSKNIQDLPAATASTTIAAAWTVLAGSPAVPVPLERVKANFAKAPGYFTLWLWLLRDE